MSKPAFEESAPAAAASGVGGPYAVEEAAAAVGSAAPTPLWSALNPGDKVAFLPTSYRVTKEERDHFATTLAAFELELYSPDNPALRNEDFKPYLNPNDPQGTPEERTAAIIDALENEDVKAIFIRGGSGAHDIVSLLQKYEESHGFSRRGIPMISYSDGEQLQDYLGNLGIVAPICGPDPIEMRVSGQPDLSRETKSASKDLEKIAELEAKEERTKKEEKELQTARENLEKRALGEAVAIESAMEIGRLLRDPSISEFPLISVNDAARAAGSIDGRIVKFNNDDARSSYRPVVDADYRPILVAEVSDHGTEAGEGMRFVMDHFKRRGELGNFRAIVLSLTDGEGFVGKTIEDCDLSEITTALGDLDIPVFFGAPYGHKQDWIEPIFSFKTIPIHTKTSIAVAADGSAILTSNQIRTAENAAEVIRLCEERRPYLEGIEDRSDIKFGARLFTPIEVENVAEVPSSTKSADCLICRFKETFKRDTLPEEIYAMDLTGQNLVIDLDDRPGNKLPYFAMKVYMNLAKLIQTGKTDELESITILSKDELPEGTMDWLRDYSKLHSLKCSLTAGQKPEHFPIIEHDEVEMRTLTIRTNGIEAAREME